MKVLGLHNNFITNPFAYCKVKKCFITEKQYSKHQCNHKHCTHLYVLNDNDNINDLTTKVYNIDDWIKYRFSDRPIQKQEQSFENHYTKRNLSSIPKLKEELKEQQSYSWYNDLQFYYQSKYNYN